MGSPCVGEASRACFRSCCPTPLLGLPEQRNPEPGGSAVEFVAAAACLLHPHMGFTNHESLPHLDRCLSNLQRAYPSYSETARADRIRDHDYDHLSGSSHVCLDYMGHGLFSGSQRLHSGAPVFNVIYKSVSLYTEITHGGREPGFESFVKRRIFRFMNVSPDDYALVFTANHPSAFKVLADSYPFHTNRNLVTVYDHENESVEAMVESCRKRSGRVDSAEFLFPNMRIQSKKLRKLVVGKRSKRKKRKRGLFVFPLQSKVTGSRYSYLWMSLAQENGWHVCLDATALGAKDMETLGLSLFQPDFLVCSFYKVFGENPSGFGCLFVKKSRSFVVKYASTSTGLVSLVQASNEPLFLQQSGSSNTDREKGHDGAVASASSSSSLSFSNREISEIQEVEEVKKEFTLSEALKLDKSLDGSESRKEEAGPSGVGLEIEFRGLDHADSLGLILISTRVRYLVNWLVNALGSLQHPHSENGLDLVWVYGPKVRVDRGPVVAFNVFDWKGEKIDPRLVQKLADRHNISLSYANMKHVCFSDKSCEETMKKRDKVDVGVAVIVASLGFLTNFEDVYRVWAFVSRFLDADFVEKERWRYMALNRTTIEV